MRIFTVGYEKMGMADFSRLVESLGIDLVVDVRRTPRSRHREWNRECLEERFPGTYIWVGLLAEQNGRLVNPDEGIRQVERALESLGRVPESGPRILLLCYEDDPRVCHRTQVASLLQGHLSSRYGQVEVEHLRVLRSARP